METNELPEGWQPDTSKIYISPSKDSIYNFVDGEWKLYRLALQSKEEEINRISENFAALQVRLGEECTKSNALEEQLKAKDEELAKLTKQRDELLQWMGERCLTPTGQQQIDSLTKEVERLRRLVDRSAKMLKAIQYGVTFGKIEEYQKLITDLSQLTDKP